jgi:hypothetical protein
MGSQSRQRRADKRRRRRVAPSSRNDRSEALPVRDAIQAAVQALGRDPSLYRALLGVLVQGGPLVAAEVDAVVREALETTAERNWAFAAVVRQAERRLSTRHGAYLREVIVGHPRMGRPVTVGSMGDAVEALALLRRLPVLPPLEGSSGTAVAGHDGRVLEKVRALLAKAESTTFPEEAEALSAKAQELMARHAIDEAMVGSADGSDNVPGGVRLPVDDPYAQAKSILRSRVSSANRCRAVWSPDLGFSTVFGFEADLQFVEVLYTSLLVQATSAMVAAGTQVDRYGRSRTRSFRQSFLVAYAARIGDRLHAAEAASEAEAAVEYGEALLPVLHGRSAAVDAACDAAFPGAIRRPVSVTNAAGWAAGSAAADLAALAGRPEVPARPA